MVAKLALSALIGLTLLAISGSAQMVRQCTCAEVAPCKNAYENSIIPCADSCQQHAAALGANYQQLRSCLVAKESQIRSAISCAESKFSNSCSRGGSKMVQKRYPETLKIAALSEINRMLSRNGVANQVQGLLSRGKKFVSCMKSCMDKKSGGCAKRLGCGLDLPSDTIMVQSAKQCAISSGFNTPGVRQLCQCAAQSGISQLNSVCPKIEIS